MRTRKILSMFLTISLFSVFPIHISVSADAAPQKNNQTIVNDTILPDEGEIEVVSIQPVTGRLKDGATIAQYDSYDSAMEALGIQFLTSVLVSDTQYTTVEIRTDNESYATLGVYNYIIGDCTKFYFIEEWGEFGRFQASEPGEIYGSGVTLDIRMALSEEQRELGVGMTFLGNLRYIETYETSDGHIVNLIGSIPDEDVPDSDAVGRKTAIFVDGGIQYQLSAVMTAETMKEVVESFFSNQQF